MPLPDKTDEREKFEVLDRYESSPQWPWSVAIILVVIYGLWAGA